MRMSPKSNLKDVLSFLRQKKCINKFNPFLSVKQCILKKKTCWPPCYPIPSTFYTLFPPFSLNFTQKVYTKYHTIANRSEVARKQQMFRAKFTSGSEMKCPWNIDKFHVCRDSRQSQPASSVNC